MLAWKFFLSGSLLRVFTISVSQMKYLISSPMMIYLMKVKFKSSGYLTHFS